MSKSGGSTKSPPGQTTNSKKRTMMLLVAVLAVGAAWGLTRGRGSLALSSAIRQLKAGDAQAASTSAETAVGLLPGNVEALVVLGDAKAALHNHAASYTAYKFAHEASPDDRDILLKMCRQGLYEQDFQYQEKELTTFLNAHNDDADAMLLLGQTYDRFPSNSANEMQALTWEQKAQQADPGNEDAAATVAGRLLAENHVDLALKASLAGLDKHPSSNRLLRLALVCYDQLGQPAEAATIATRLAGIAPVNDETPPYHANIDIPGTTGPLTVPAKFVDVAASAGLDYSFKFVDSKPLNILQTIGNGCAYLDYDNDGNLDVLLVSPLVKLYHGDGKGHFADVTAALGMDKPQGYFLGCAVGDFDNDGFDDILLTGYNCAALLRNNAGHGFVDITKKSGIQTSGWNTSAAWGDIDNDGRLDLYICRYAQYSLTDNPYCIDQNIVSGCGPNAYKPQRGVLYHNDGGGHFSDVTAQWGAGTVNGKNLGAAFADFDQSGHVSLYLASDKVPSTLYANTGAHFSDISHASGTSVREDGAGFSGMGVDWGDYDNDGKLDLAAMTFQNENKRILHNEGAHLFTQQASPLGLEPGTDPWVAFGMKWFDYDNDGWLDLMIANGHVDDNIQERIARSPFLEPTQLYHNDNGTHFTPVKSSSIQ